jgi:hypothetical protein
LQDIDSGLQTCFAQAFSDAGLDAIALRGNRVVSAVVLPVGGIFQQAVSVICEDDVLIVSFPAFLARVLLFQLALVAAATDLAIAGTRIWKE